MKIEHIAIWVKDLEQMKDFYCRYFTGRAGKKCTNPKKQFESYFLSFEGGFRLELMHMPSISDSTNDSYKQFTGLSILQYLLETKKSK